MGQLTMPKHSGETSLIKSILEFYSSIQDWRSNSELIEYCRNSLNRAGDDSSQTKLAQWPAYFRFIEWQDPTLRTSAKRITDSGLAFYQALENNNQNEINRILLESMENISFGRGAHGVPSSDSDYEPPNIAIRIALTLDYFTREEYRYILDQLVTFEKPIFDLISNVKKIRKTNQRNYPAITNPYVADDKIIQVLNEFNFIQEEDGKYTIPQNLLYTYLDRLNALKIKNNEDFVPLQQQEDVELCLGSNLNRIFYGAPGTGKSHKVKELVKGKEERTERVTFHPEYDYNAFVGGYKPTMDGKDIRYEFVPQAFSNIYVKAWNDLENDYYLVIEEINRGNCAEIFGDIFQLLDRTNDYHITPSKELKEYLNAQFFDNSKIDGLKLILPPNLNILATMNTSDQSLFPMDSAFKRRWDWEYVPINYNFSDDNKSSIFKVKLSETENFSWLSFILSVNSFIKQNDNLGMDKCLGNYFIKPATEEIDIETFINKAIFYLWNDVFKDEDEENNIFINKTTYEDFFPIQTKGIIKVKEILDILKVNYTTTEL